MLNCFTLTERYPFQKISTSLATQDGNKRKATMNSSLILRISYFHGILVVYILLKSKVSSQKFNTTSPLRAGLQLELTYLSKERSKTSKIDLPQELVGRSFSVSSADISRVSAAKSFNTKGVKMGNRRQNQKHLLAL